MEKSVDAFRTISEVAIDLEVPQHVLRFWETKFPQVKPLKRGGGRRYYRPDDVNLLRSIRSLLYREGYTIRGVQQILKAQGARAVAALPTQDDRIELSTTAAVELSEPHAPSEDDRAAMPPQPSGPDKLPDDFFDRPLPNPIVPMERWRILTLIEEVQACAQRLAIAHSRHVALVEKARSALSSSPLNHSVDAP